MVLVKKLADAVHSGYAHYRRAVIEAGVELYEARADAAGELVSTTANVEMLTMHTKAMIIDRSRLFVGSLNLDPRSIEINSEMGLVVDSAQMSNSLANRLFDSLDSWTYRLRLNERGRLRWHGTARHGTVNGVASIEKKEPLTSFWRRMSAWFLKIAPERQL